VDYEAFSAEVLSLISDLPISFEVFADDFDTMYRQALKIDSWGENVYVKIPISNTKGDSTVPLIKDLVAKGIKLNVTAILTLKQVEDVDLVLNAQVPSIVSVFAGRIADTGIDPVPVMQKSSQILKAHSRAELLWASPREVLNVYQAEECGCEIITLPPDILKKLGMRNKDLLELSRETVQMFYDDSLKSGFQIEC
jgi:transaldolase